MTWGPILSGQFRGLVTAGLHTDVTIVLAADTALKIATRSMRSDNYPRASTETLRVPWRTPDMMHNNRALTRAWRRSALVRFPAYLTVIALACSEASKSSDDGDGAGGTGASSPGGTGGTSMSSGGVIRMMVDFSDVERSTFISPPGQSGHFMGPSHDRDLGRLALLRRDGVPGRAGHRPAHHRGGRTCSLRS